MFKIINLSCHDDTQSRIQDYVRAPGGAKYKLNKVFTIFVSINNIKIIHLLGGECNGRRVKHPNPPGYATDGTHNNQIGKKILIS